ncbi:MAG: hypothetical protein WBO38_14600 [Chitinophagaceae bacterium]
MKILKFSGIFLGAITILLIGFHFWINYNARHIIEDLVDTKSKGKLKLKVEKFRFSWFSRKVELQNAYIYSTDSVNTSTSYRFRVANIKLTVQEILPIILSKKLFIDSLNLEKPEITVTRLKAFTERDRSLKKEVSIPEELGKIYNSIQDALQVLKVNRFQITNAKFTLVNKIQPGQLPLTISNIDFFIDNLSVDTARLSGKEKIFFSENVVLRSRDQDIVFPDGRHRLSYSQFRVNLKKQLVEFDSCTIAAVQKDSTTSAFRVFFDTLRLTNIDFDTLYRSELIKADSVYCLNPKFILEVELGKKSEGGKRTVPKLGDIIKQLTGNLQLGFVVVDNADFNIKTINDEKPTSFAFTNNNFELQGLSVDQDAAKPLKVKSLALAIRNYENFIKDSSYNVKFDSILFREDKIYLSHFIFNKLDNGKIINTFSIPQFRLDGLSWDDLVFKRQLKANAATLYQPSINYKVSVKKTTKKGRKNIFAVLGDIGQMIQLDKMNIVNGRVDLALNNNSSVHLEDASIIIQTQRLLTAKKASALEHAVEYLDFKTGTIKTNNFDIKLYDVRYTGDKNGYLLAKRAQLNERLSRTMIMAENAAVDEILIDEETSDLTATGIRWDKADVKVVLPEKREMENTNNAAIELKNIKGSNTTAIIKTGNITISTHLDNLSLDELLKEPGKEMQLKNLATAGKQLKIVDTFSSLTVSDYVIADGKSSILQDVSYYNNKNNNVISLSLPSIATTPDINSILNGKIKLSSLNLIRPVASLSLSTIHLPGEEKGSKMPEVDIDKIIILQPVINFNQHTEKGNLNINWDGSIEKDNRLELTNILVNAGNFTDITVGKVLLNLNHFSYSEPKGKTFHTGDGEVATEISAIKWQQESGKKPAWRAKVDDFTARNFHFDSLGKNHGILVINKTGLKGLSISSSSINNLQKLAGANSSFQLQQFTGNYKDDKTEFRWFNAGFNQNSKIFTLDSFSFNPTLSRESFLSKLTFQKDYINGGTGAIQIGPIDIDKYSKDMVLDIDCIKVDNPYLNDYKDKSLPFAAGTIKPLPANMIKKIPFQISVDTIQLNNAKVDYTEVSEKTKMPGTIPVTRLAVNLFNIKNYNLTATDSLSIHAYGYVMDTVWVRLRVKESYTDSLGGFLMTVRLKPGDVTVLNPVLIPLASVKLISGQFDTINMRAVGREYLSLGEMKMFYKDLKFQLLRDGKVEKKSFFTRMITFVATSFVIRKNNNSRTGNVFFIRQRDKSAINYLIKIAFSGMASSIGVKNNKKMIRKYRNELEKRGLPPIEFE